MSPRGDLQTVPGPLDELPTFELDYGFDDPDEPEEVTIFAPDADPVTTSWISVEASYAVPIEDVA